MFLSVNSGLVKARIIENIKLAFILFWHSMNERKIDIIANQKPKSSSLKDHVENLNDLSIQNVSDRRSFYNLT